jgi:adenine-specific DNA-methyltransferase
MQIIDFGDLPVFEEATTYPCIMHKVKSTPTETFQAAKINTLNFINGLENYIEENTNTISASHLQPEGWTLTDSSNQQLSGQNQEQRHPLGRVCKW